MSRSSELSNHLILANRSLSRLGDLLNIIRRSGTRWLDGHEMDDMNGAQCLVEDIKQWKANQLCNLPPRHQQAVQQAENSTTAHFIAIKEIYEADRKLKQWCDENDHLIAKEYYKQFLQEFKKTIGSALKAHSPLARS